MDLTLAPPSAAVSAFAGEVGGLHDGPVSVVGGRTHWNVGGEADRDVRELRAPSGILEHEPAELVVRCGAGTPIAELDEALARHGQMCPIDARADSTVGGVLSVGFSGVRRLRYGPLRDLLLEARSVAADGEIIKAGAPVVKNVTGYDMCRLLVGSIGTLGLLGEVVLRCRPVPARALWLRGDGVDPWAARRATFAPSSVLWDSVSTWMLFEGHPDDLAAERHAVGRVGSWVEVAGPPPLPEGGRLSMAPKNLRSFDPAGFGPFVAEIGIGTVHGTYCPPTESPVTPESAALQRRLKHAFDPVARLNPGRRAF